MFDIAWTELLVIAVVAIVVVGPRELPRLLRTIGQVVSKVRAMANEFKTQLDEAVKDSGLDEVKSKLAGMADEVNPAKNLRDAIDPLEKGIEEDFAKLSNVEDMDDFDEDLIEYDAEDNWEIVDEPDNKTRSAAEAESDGTRLVKPDAVGERDASSNQTSEAEVKPQSSSSEPKTSGSHQTNGAHRNGLDAAHDDLALSEKTGA